MRVLRNWISLKFLNQLFPAFFFLKSLLSKAELGSQCMSKWPFAKPIEKPIICWIFLGAIQKKRNAKSRLLDRSPSSSRPPSKRYVFSEPGLKKIEIFLKNWLKNCWIGSQIAELVQKLLNWFNNIELNIENPSRHLNFFTSVELKPNYSQNDVLNWFKVAELTQMHQIGNATKCQNWTFNYFIEKLLNVAELRPKKF